MRIQKIEDTFTGVAAPNTSTISEQNAKVNSIMVNTEESETKELQGWSEYTDFSSTGKAKSVKKCSPTKYDKQKPVYRDPVRPEMKDKEPPVMIDSNPPTIDEEEQQVLLEELNTQYEDLKGQSVKLDDGTEVFYNERGYIIGKKNAQGMVILITNRQNNEALEKDVAYIDCEYDSSGKVPIRALYHDMNGNLCSSSKAYTDYECDENGNPTRETHRLKDGTICSYKDSEYDENNRKTREIPRNKDGRLRNTHNVPAYTEYSYEENGNKREIFRNCDGTLDFYIQNEYREDGKRTQQVFYNKDGKLNFYIDSEYNENGKLVKEIYRDPNGVVKREKLQK